MSQFPSPLTPPPDDNSAPPRRLISPQERFAEPVAQSDSDLAPYAFASDALASDAFAPDDASAESFAEENPFDAQLSARWRDEMARRHLPPSERARQERARLQREGISRRAAPPKYGPSPATGEAADASPASGEAGSSTQRGRAERDFVRTARGAARSVAARQKRRVPRWLKQLVALTALIFVGLCGFQALTAPQFNIETVEIRGVDAAPAAAVQTLARALVGQNWLRVQRGATERAVAALPIVARARVVRLLHWPPQVALQITERQPFLKVGAGADWWVVDENGVPFRRPNAKDGALYSAVAPQFAPQVGHPLDAKVWARAKALQLALEDDNRGAASEKKTAAEAARWQLRRIYFDRDGLASLRLSGAPHREMLVRLGDESWPEKLARARQSLAYFERTGRRAAELDLVSLERPVWTPIAPQRVAQNAAPSGAKTAPGAG